MIGLERPPVRRRVPSLPRKGRGKKRAEPIRWKPYDSLFRACRFEVWSTREARVKTKLASPTLNALRPLAPAYAGLLGLSLFLPFLYFSAPLFVSQIMERVTASRSETTLYLLAVIALFLLAIHAFLEWVRQKTLQRIGADIDQRLSLILFDAMHRPRRRRG
ncbi:MAG: hypothetical protein HC829_01550 [Bacteroidales bacterium]|nr:hypothetical protein [Bacteroidales bacterium]